MSPKYDAQCPQCGNVQEYEASILSYKENTPMCDNPECGTKTEHKFTGNAGGFLLNGNGWPGETIKKQRAHKRAVKADPKEYWESGGRTLKKD